MFRKNNTFLNIVNSVLWDLPTPSSISYFWNFGSVLGVCLGVQILSGFFLSLHYISFSLESFSSVILIMREVWYGWLIRFIHMNGASIFFFFLYLHLFRGIYFFSAVHKKVWISGIFIMFMLMAVSFLGYVLPWGQMSYWAVAVITNLFSVVPLIGHSLVEWIWGGFTVGLPTLIRFYSLHFILPFVVLFLISLHLVFLHSEGSSNSLGFNSNVDKLPFHPYFSIKDFFFIVLMVFSLMFLSFYYPYLMADPVNNIPCNFMQTPEHIQPEWYFLSYYAILRSISSKSGGVIALFSSILILLVLLFFDYEFSLSFSYYRFFIFWFFIFNYLFLIKLGSLPAEDPYVSLSQLSSFFYFLSLVFVNF